MRKDFLLTKLVLASASPRRSDLLKRMRLDFEVMPSSIDENYDESLSVNEVAQYLAEIKAEDVLNKVGDALIIGADTIVVKENQILGKPADFDEAVIMINMLSGSWHKVITGICVLSRDLRIVTSVITDVHFAELSHDEILRYVKVGESYDKAGAYGVQGMAGMFIDEIHGDYYNIMGFPMSAVRKILKDIGLL